MLGYQHHTTTVDKSFVTLEGAANPEGFGGWSTFKDNKAFIVDKKQYSEYLKSDHWRGTAELIKARDNYVCMKCQSGNDLNVHHSTYKDIGNEKPHQLFTLCEKCHHLLHATLPKGGNLFGHTLSFLPRYSPPTTAPSLRQHNKPKSKERLAAINRRKRVQEKRARDDAKRRMKGKKFTPSTAGNGRYIRIG